MRRRAARPTTARPSLLLRGKTRGEASPTRRHRKSFCRLVRPCPAPSIVLAACAAAAPVTAPAITSIAFVLHYSLRHETQQQEMKQNPAAACSVCNYMQRIARLVFILHTCPAVRPAPHRQGFTGKVAAPSPRPSPSGSSRALILLQDTNS